MTAEKSKTGAVLRSLLKDCTYPGDYETLKNKWKVNPKLYEEEMKKLSAKIGVKLQILYDKWWCKMISIEKKPSKPQTHWRQLTRKWKIPTKF